MIAPGLYHVITCVAESPWMWGGSVDVKVTVNGVIEKIVVQAQTHCGVPSGVGSKIFAAHCGCGGSCSLTGAWEVIYKR